MVDIDSSVTVFVNLRSMQFRIITSVLRRIYSQNLDPRFNRPKAQNGFILRLSYVIEAGLALSMQRIN